ncbi:MAG: glycosyltransferase [Candidatus Scalindua sp.]
MACECVPVVTRIPALEEEVGGCGIYLDDPITPEEIAGKVQIALQHPELGKCARQRVIENFSLEGWSKKLLEVVNSLEKGKH